MMLDNFNETLAMSITQISLYTQERIKELEGRIEIIENNYVTKYTYPEFKSNDTNNYADINQAYYKGYQEGKESSKNNLEFKDLITEFYKKSVEEIKALVKKQKMVMNAYKNSYLENLKENEESDVEIFIGHLGKLHTLIEKHFGK